MSDKWSVPEVDTLPGGWAVARDPLLPQRYFQGTQVLFSP